MPRKGVKIEPENFFPENLMEEHNKKWLVEVRKIKSKKSYCNVYISNLSKFLLFRGFGNKPFNTFITEDVLDYIAEMKKSDYRAGTRNSIVSTVTSFKNFLSEEYPLIFGKNFLPDLSSLKDVDLDAKEFDDERVNLTQLSTIREYNKKNIQDEYIFEIFFQLDIKKEDLKICHPRNRDKELGKFIYEAKEIEYNAKIDELLGKLGDVKNWEWSLHNVNKYLKRITKHLREFGYYSKERDFSYSDIKASHGAYILKCPICYRSFENIKENWVLASSDVSNDDEYHLVCAVCKGWPNGD
jgi:hypothetical protein